MPKNTIQEHKIHKELETAFTLIEVMIVVVIIGILAVIAIPAMLAQQEAAHAATLKSDMRNAAAQIVHNASMTTPKHANVIPITSETVYVGRGISETMFNTGFSGDYETYINSYPINITHTENNILTATAGISTHGGVYNGEWCIIGAIGKDGIPSNTALNSTLYKDKEIAVFGDDLELTYRQDFTNKIPGTSCERLAIENGFI